MVDARRQKQIAGLIAEVAAEFIERESNRQSLITVTRATVHPKLTRATIYISVLPEEKETEALHFVRRKASELRGYLKKQTELRRIPFLSIEIDRGEKNRQKIFEISAQDNKTSSAESA